MTVASTTTGVCTVADGRVSFVAAGSCTVDLVAEVTAEYDEVVETRTIPVTLVPVTLTV